MRDQGALCHSRLVPQTLANAILIIPPFSIVIVVGCDLLKHVRRERVFEGHFSGPTSILFCELTFLCTALSSPSRPAGVADADEHAGRDFLRSEIVDGVTHRLTRPNTVVAGRAMGKQLTYHLVADIGAAILAGERRYGASQTRTS